jgi:uncharacterized protein (TIGR03790 family)
MTCRWQHGGMNNIRVSTVCLVCAWVLMAAEPAAWAQSPAGRSAPGDAKTGGPAPLATRVLVIENGDSPTSMRIARHYMKQRGVTRKVTVHCPDSATDKAKETLAYAEFQKNIEVPLKSYLAQDPSIDFIVLTKGVPIRLTDAPTGMGGKQPSLDSYLAAFDYFERPDAIQIELNDSGFTGKAFVNRFWNSSERFSHAKFGGYLVTRLDGYTAEQAMRLTNSAIKSEKNQPTGRILLDVAASHGLIDPALVPFSPLKDGAVDNRALNEMPYNAWDTDLTVAAQRLEKAGVPVTLDLTEEFVGKATGLMGYSSWGSNDPKFSAENYASLRFAPGAIAETAVSTSARTMLPTTGGQSLIADLVTNGVSGVKGYCDEPLLQAVASPSILFDRYTQGWTMAESFYAASRFVGWEDIVIGDPLCAPFSTSK